MTDAPPRKRRWFQLHLSTCVVLMFVAGALMWTNVSNISYHWDGLSGRRGWTAWGWPFPCGVLDEVEYLYPNDDRESDAPRVRVLGAFDLNILGDPNVLYRAAFANLVIALVLLAATAFSCEWFIRRRVAAKGGAA